MQSRKLLHSNVMPASDKTRNILLDINERERGNLSAKKDTKKFYRNSFGSCFRVRKKEKKNYLFK